MARTQDQLGLVALTVYILGALASWPAGAVRLPGTGVLLQLFLLLPVVGAGAGIYALLRARRGEAVTPTGLAAAGLGAGVVVRVTWQVIVAPWLYGNPLGTRSGSSDDRLGPGPELLWGVAYAYLCIVSAGIALFYLPRLVRALVAAFDRPTGPH